MRRHFAFLLLPAMVFAQLAAAQPTLVQDFNKSADAYVGSMAPFNGKLYFTATDPVHGSELRMYDGSNEPVLVQDIYPGTYGSGPAQLTVFNDKLYFVANNGTNGPELWAYDGNTAPAMVYDIYPGANYRTPRQVTVFNNKLYFVTDDGTTGYELWQYDGVNTPTLVYDLNPGFNASNPSYLTVFENKLYFSAFEPTHSTELWVFDGINDPALVWDIYSGASPSNPSHLTVFAGKLYFSANDGVNGAELWTYDGVNPPSIVYDINAGSAHTYPQHLEVFDSKLYFNGYDPIHGSELWAYDGTNTPSLVADVFSGVSSSIPQHLTVFDGKLHFTARDQAHGFELWAYDGSSPPALVQDIYTGPDGSTPSNATIFNNQLYFSADNGTNGYELWRYDGSNPAILVADINPGGSSYPQNFISFNNRLFFTLDDGAAGYEMWEYDGVNPATLLSDILPGSNSSSPTDLTLFNNKLYFRAYERNYGAELWVYDGTAAPALAHDLAPGTFNSSPAHLTVFDGKLYFSAGDNTHGRELWSYDGLNAPTRVADILAGYSSSSPTYLTVAGDKLYFVAYTQSTGRELWEYDGVNPPALVQDIFPGFRDSYIQYLTEFNGKLYFNANNGTNGYELWVYDGTNAPTMVADLVPGGGSSSPQFLTAFNGKLYFGAADVTNGRELWAYDGINPPALVYDIEPGTGSSWPRFFREFQGQLYFSATRSDVGYELWRYDGTDPPQLVSDAIRPGPSSSSPFGMYGFNGSLYFRADDGQTGQELWRLAVSCATPAVLFSADQAAVGTPTTFTDASANIAEGATYAWDFDSDGTTDATTVGSAAFTYPAAGDYTATLTITNDAGCSNSRSLSVRVLPLYEPGIFWTDDVTDKVQGAGLDGSNVVDLVNTGLSHPNGIDVDPISRKIYWVDDVTEKIQRSNLDGTGVEDLITSNLLYPFGLALDVAAGKMYWTDLTAGKIQRADLDGSNVEDLITSGLNSPFGIALDTDNGKMYWTDMGNATIMRADLDGGNPESVINSGLTGPFGIVVDPTAGKIYFTDNSAGKILRADLDGGNPQELVTGLTTPRGIDLDLINGKMYWTDISTDKIQRADLDGSNVEDLVTSGLGDPEDLAVITCNFVPAFTTDVAVAGSATQFTDQSTGLTTAAAYAWDFDLNGQVDAAAAGNTSYAYPGDGAYQAGLTITDQGCVAGFTAPVTVEINPNLSYEEILKKVAGDREAADGFGYSVAIGNNYAVVGAYREQHAADGSSDPLSNAGAAYIFKRDAGGAENWGQIRKIVASDRGWGDFYGRSVAISGDYIVVGADEEDAGGSNAGAVYIYKRDQGGPDNWGEIRKIVLPDAANGDKFGAEVAIDGDYLLVSAHLKSAVSWYSGAAYIFKKDEGGPDNWGQVQRLIPSDSELFDVFGRGVDISGEYAIVGATGEDAGGSDAGAAYIFRKDQGGADNWGEVKKIVASDPAMQDYFGFSVAVHGDHALVGAYEEDDNGTTAGAAYIYRKDAGGADNWGQIKKLTASDAEAGDYFGYRVALYSSYALVGAYWENGGSFNEGAIYLFKRDEGGPDNWGEAQKLKSSDISGVDYFGGSIDIFGSQIIVGAYFEDEDEFGMNTLSGAGSAYIFKGVVAVLPVELTYFEAARRDEQAWLEWGTSAEQNNRGFHIQRSPDGRQWATIGFVAGNGTTSDPLTYSFIDERPGSGVNYYRLEQEDFDGSTEYSEVRTVVFPSAERPIMVYPNPFNDFVRIDNGQGRVVIYDVLGQMVRTWRNRETQAILDTRSLAVGSYLIQVRHENGAIYTEKFVKVK